MTLHTETANIKGHVYQVIRSGASALVSSKSEPGAWYPVRDGKCSCAWAQKSGSDRPCAHLSALALCHFQEEIATAERNLEAMRAEAAQLSGCTPNACQHCGKALKSATAMYCSYDCQPSAAPASKLHRLSAEAQAAIL